MSNSIITFKRRTALQAAAAAVLARPAVAQTDPRTLLFVPQANLTSLDPIWTTATVTRNFAYLVYDTLYGVDGTLTPRPQMAQGHTVSADGLVWTVTLRPGLRFHDGEPVRAVDCVASVQRWMQRDSLGQTVAARLDAVTAPDDRTMVFRLRRPFPRLDWALGKSQPSAAFIMPERLARTDPFTAVTQAVGSGPFRFQANEYVSGSRAAFARFDGYVPRGEPPDGTAGGKRAMVDRVEWRIVGDAATAAAALRAGEVDWVEQPLVDLVPSLRADPRLAVGALDRYGLYPVLRFNCTQGPTARLGVRQAILAAVDPAEVMQAVMGENRAGWHAPIGCFLPDTPSANSTGFERLGGPGRMDAAKRVLAASGYDGERLVLLHPTDQPAYDAMAQVAAAACQALGLRIDDQAMDYGTVVRRRASREPLDRGGWSMFASAFPALDFVDPLGAPPIRGNGDAAWFGWPDAPGVEALRDAWLDAPTDAERPAIAARLQEAVFEQALFVPLGQYRPSTAYSRRLTGLVSAPLPVFWGVAKA